MPRSAQVIANEIHAVKQKAEADIIVLRDEMDQNELSDILGLTFIGPGGDTFQALSVVRDPGSLRGPEVMIKGRLKSTAQYDPNVLRKDWTLKR